MVFRKNVSIANMSFSYSADSDEQLNTSSPLRIAMEEAFEVNGTLFIAAAGNSSSNNDNSLEAAFPATYPNDNIIAVASIDCEGELSEFSSYGEQSVDLAAPGENISGAWLDGEITVIHGTSSACANTARVAAQLAAHQTQFDYVPIKCAILNGATYHPSLGNKTVSNGYLNGLDAYNEFINNCNGVPGGGGWSNRRNFDQEPNNFSLNYMVNNLGIEVEIQNSKSEQFKVEIYNLMGQQVSHMAFPLLEGNAELSIPMVQETLAEIYFVHLRVGDYMETIKVLR